MLIIHTDAIGDYILFRNFIEAIKNAEKFNQHKITLLGNQAYRELAEYFDGRLIDNFIWFSRGQFENDFKYRKILLKSLQNTEYDFVINPSYSRDFIFGDSLVRAANAKCKIGQVADKTNSYSFLTSLSNKWYSKLIDTSNVPMFEFYRNKIFCEKLIEKKSCIEKPTLAYQKSTSENLVAMLFPGAGEKQKQWSSENFAVVADELFAKGFSIKICGAKSDIELANTIINSCKKATPENRCGQTSLTELTQEIANTTILITNDSSALHLAVCTNTKAVCVLSGRHYGRFAPYPAEMNVPIRFIYPEIIEMEVQKNARNVIERTKHFSFANINDIPTQKVLSAIEQLLT